MCLRIYDDISTGLSSVIILFLDPIHSSCSVTSPGDPPKCGRRPCVPNVADPSKFSCLCIHGAVYDSVTKTCVQLKRDEKMSIREFARFLLLIFIFLSSIFLYRFRVINFAVHVKKKNVCEK